jgi:hypothetical protein
MRVSFGIASLILALEIVASDYGGWGRRLPWAMRKAEEFRRAHMLTSRTPMMDRYLYPPHYIGPEFTNLLTPPESAAGPHRARGASDGAGAKPPHLTPDELGWPR